MKCAILTDTHWGFKRSNKVFEEHIAAFHDNFVSYLIENKIKHVLHLGDFFDVRSSVNLITLQTVKTRFLDKLKAANITMHVIPGNHDCSYRHSLEANSVSLVFREYPNINVYNKPTVVEFEDKTNLLMVPWISKEDEKDFLNEVDLASTATKICVGHFEFSGFVYQKGVIATEGMEASIFTPKFNLILSGHYHSKSTKGSVNYLGTQYQLTWADADEKKYFHIVDTKKNKLEEVENANSIFHKIFYDEDLVEKFDYAPNIKDCIVKVVIIKRKNMIKFDEFMEKLYEKSPYEVTVVDESVVQAQKELKVDPKLLLKSTEEIITEIIDSMDFDGYNIDTIKKQMHDLFMESQH